MIKKKAKYRNANGFTLVELLVVILVLGILAGISVSRLSTLTDVFKKAADTFSAQSHARDVELKLVTGVLDGPTDGNEIVILPSDLGVDTLDAQYMDYDFKITVETSSSSSYDWIIRVAYTDGTNTYPIDSDGEDGIEGYEKYVIMIE